MRRAIGKLPGARALMHCCGRTNIGASSDWVCRMCWQVEGFLKSIRGLGETQTTD